MVVGPTRGQSQFLLGKSYTPLNLQFFTPGSTDLSFLRRFVERLGRWTFYRRQPQEDKETGEEPAEPLQTLTSPNTRDEDVKDVYRKALYSRFGEGKLIDTIMEKIYLWESGL